MREVAKAAGVSTMTVSNVLTGRRFVSADTRRRVLAVVERTGYQVNVAARNLRQGRTGTIGLAVHELDSQYFGLLATRLARRLAQEGFRVVVEQTGADREGELAAIADSRVNAYDGLILSSNILSSGDVQSLIGDLPVVMLGEQRMDPFDQVEMANLAGAEAAARLLLEQGCRHLVALGMPPQDSSPFRVGNVEDVFGLRGEGVRRAVNAQHDADLITVQSGGHDFVHGVRMAREALRQMRYADGFVCSTDTVAFGAIRALADLGVRVPDDVLVVGFDDVTAASFAVPSLSSVSPGHDAMVEAAARLLLRRISDRRAPVERFVAPFSVIERESTRRPVPE